jgi:hypothetical protein
MSLRIYIAYGAPANQVTALRLQALAAVNGLTVYVPLAYTRQDASGQLDPQSDLRLREADVVLGIVTFVASDACWLELNTGKRLGKKIIVLADPGIAQDLMPHFPGSILAIDPLNPAQAEASLVEFFKNANLQSNLTTALLALGTIALGLLLFSPQD